MGSVNIVFLGSGKFDNPLSNPFTGVVSIAYQAAIDPSNLAGFSVRTNIRDGDTNQVLAPSKIQTFTVSPSTTTLTSAVSFQFDILENDQFPAFVNISMEIFAGSSQTNDPDVNINFTGVQPTLTQPQIDWITTEFQNFPEPIFENNTFTSEIIVKATDKFNDLFSNQILSLFVQIKDDGGVALDLQKFDFQISQGQTKSFPITSANLKRNTISVQLFVHDIQGRAYSPITKKEFSQVLEPPSLCTTGFHPETLQGKTVCVADDQDNPPIDAKFCESCGIFIFAFETCPICEPPSPCPPLFHEEIIGGAAVCVADDQNNPPPDSQFCEKCGIHIFLFDTCPICADPPPTDQNICFRLVFKDASNLSFVLSKADFDFLVANPVKLAGVGDQYSIAFSEPCSDPAQVLSDVLQAIFDKIKEVNEDLIDVTMVSIQPNPFVINDDNTFSGSVKFVATPTFNPFFFGKTIITVLQVKDEFGVVLDPNNFHVNDLNFTAIERDEIISYTGFGAFGKEKLRLEFFVFNNAQDMTAFSNPAVVIVTKEGSTTPPTNGDGGIKFGTGILGKVAGVFLGLTALCLIGSKEK